MSENKVQKMKFRSRKCLNCGKEVSEYDVFTFEGRYEDENGNVLGTHEVLKACCPNCGQPFRVPELEKKNSRKRSELSNKLFNTLSVKQICSLPRKYNIPRKYFEIVLGINESHINDDGEYTTWDVWNGDSPNFEEEVALSEVMASPSYYIDLLNGVKEQLPKDVYEKSLKRAEGLAKKENKK